MTEKQSKLFRAVLADLKDFIEDVKGVDNTRLSNSLQRLIWAMNRNE